jgi:hypothetical protein
VSEVVDVSFGEHKSALDLATAHVHVVKVTVIDVAD